MTTKKQRDLVAGMKWPPCELTPTKTTRPEGRVSPRFAVEDQGDRFILSPEAYAELVRKINLGIAALERLVGCDASYDLIEHDGVKHCVYCGREYLAADVDEKLCPSEDCPGFVCRAALKEMKK